MGRALSHGRNVVVQGLFEGPAIVSLRISDIFLDNTCYTCSEVLKCKY